MEKTLEKILVVCGRKNIRNGLCLQLNGRVIVINAFTIQEALKRFSIGVDDIAAIVIEDDVLGGKPVQISFMRDVRDAFEGPILAVSDFASCRDMFCQVGYDACKREESPRKLLQILGLL